MFLIAVLRLYQHFTYPQNPGEIRTPDSSLVFSYGPARLSLQHEFYTYIIQAMGREMCVMCETVVTVMGAV